MTYSVIFELTKLMAKWTFNAINLKTFALLLVEIPPDNNDNKFIERAENLFVISMRLRGT